MTSALVSKVEAVVSRKIPISRAAIRLNVDFPVMDGPKMVV
jgi:hypothetical protein